MSPRFNEVVTNIDQLRDKVYDLNQRDVVLTIQITNVVALNNHDKVSYHVTSPLMDELVVQENMLDNCTYEGINLAMVEFELKLAMIGEFNIKVFVESTFNGGTKWEQEFVLTVQAPPPPPPEQPQPRLEIVEQPQAISYVEIGEVLELRVGAELKEGEGVIEYMWFSSLDGSNAVGAPIQGANSQAYSVPTGMEGEYVYYVEISATVSGKDISMCSNIAVVKISNPSLGDGGEDIDTGGGDNSGGEVDIDAGGDVKPNQDDNLDVVTILFVLLLGLGIVVILTALVLLKIKRQTNPKRMKSRW
jgi:hypothetical protein